MTAALLAKRSLTHTRLHKISSDINQLSLATRGSPKIRRPRDRFRKPRSGHESRRFQLGADALLLASLKGSADFRFLTREVQKIHPLKWDAICDSSATGLRHRSRLIPSPPTT